MSVWVLKFGFSVVFFVGLIGISATYKDGPKDFFEGLPKDLLPLIWESLEGIDAKCFYLAAARFQPYHEQVVSRWAPHKELSEDDLDLFDEACQRQNDQIVDIDEKQTGQALGPHIYEDLTVALNLWFDWAKAKKVDKAIELILWRILIQLVQRGTSFDKVKSSPQGIALIYRQLVEHDSLISAYVFWTNCLPAMDDHGNNLVLEADKKVGSRILDELVMKRTAFVINKNKALQASRLGTESLFGGNYDCGIFRGLNLIGCGLKNLAALQEVERLNWIHHRLAWTDNPKAIVKMVDNHLVVLSKTSNLVERAVQLHAKNLLQAIHERWKNRENVDKAIAKMVRDWSGRLEKGTLIRDQILEMITHRDVIDLLGRTEKGYRFMADVAIAPGDDEEVGPLKRMCKRGLALEARRWSLIHEAVSKASRQALSYLVTMPGAREFVASAHNDTVLESPLFLIKNCSQTDILKALMRTGISLAPINKANKDTFLMHVIRLSLGNQKFLMTKIILHALRKQANGLADPNWINLCNAAGQTAFSLASDKRHLLALMVPAGANPPLAIPPDYPFPISTAVPTVVIPDISMGTILQLHARGFPFFQKDEVSNQIPIHQFMLTSKNPYELFAFATKYFPEETNYVRGHNQKTLQDIYKERGEELYHRFHHCVESLREGLAELISPRATEDLN